MVRVRLAAGRGERHSSQSRALTKRTVGNPRPAATLMSTRASQSGGPGSAGGENHASNDGLRGGRVSFSLSLPFNLAHARQAGEFRAAGQEAEVDPSKEPRTKLSNLP